MLSKIFKKSIFYKLFFMNLIILICIVVSQMLFQLLYFESYYLKEKNKAISKEIVKFSEFLNEENDKVKVMEYIDEVNKETGITLSFISESENESIIPQSYMGSRYIEVIDSRSAKEYKIILGDQFQELSIKNGDMINTYGIEDEYGYIFPEKIFKNNVEVKSIYNIVPIRPIETSEYLESSIPSKIVEPARELSESGQPTYVSGVVSDIQYQSESYLSNIDVYLSDENRANIFSNEKYNTTLKNTISNSEVLISSEIFKDGNILGSSFLSQVNDVIGTMNSYYIIIFIVIFGLVIIISLAYSKFMIKPLVDMSRVAKRISERDFTQNYEVRSEDEIGVLGNSLNLISDNLEEALRDLVDANVMLKEDINIQITQEEKRKELIGNISHELKTPITIIQGSINGIKSGMYSVEMYDDILEETIKMNDLVMEMLEISKLESPSFKLKKEPFDLCSIFLKERDKLKSMIIEKKLNLTFDIEEEAVVVGDEKRINQVITNLMTNAIKYTPIGENIIVKVKLEESENRYKFIIENFGVKLEDEDLKNIWDSFYRGEKSRNKKYGGTGLGLFIVKRILELHKSNFGVENGSNSVRFFFDLEFYDIDNITV